MLRSFLLSYMLLSGVCVLSGQSFWNKTNESRIQVRSNVNREIIPQKYQTFSLNLDGLKSYLADAPMERSDSRNGKEHMPLEIPMPDGSTELFLIQESPVMDWEISQRYPDIKSYKGFSAVNALNQIRFAVTPKGFHASLFTESGEIYIDPYSSENNTDYQVYYTHDYKDYSLIPGTWCGASDSGRPSIGNLHGGQRGGGPLVELRVYRLAMGCTGEWGAKRGTVAKCMEDLNIVVTRMNQIYERELAIRFVLINTTDKLIFIDGATDPYDTPLEGKKMVGSNTSKINAIIESNSYDIGHVFTVGCTDGIAGASTTWIIVPIEQGKWCHLPGFTESISYSHQSAGS